MARLSSYSPALLLPLLTSGGGSHGSRVLVDDGMSQKLQLAGGQGGHLRRGSKRGRMRDSGRGGMRGRARQHRGAAGRCEDAAARKTPA
jgi:hypothetical protein